MSLITRAVMVLFLFGIYSQAHAYPPAPGKRYDVGGYHMHIHCTGTGQPTIIIDAGLGEDSSNWTEVQQLSSVVSKTCVFDRPGYGWSDDGPQPRNSSRIAYELQQLLKKADITPPYVLVGHSFGGYNIRVFTSSNPQDVSGMVLVDASHEQQFSQLGIKLPKIYSRRSSVLILPKATDDMADENKPTSLRERAIQAAKAEISSLSQSSMQVQRYRSLPTVPLIVITRGKPEWQGTEAADKREKTWLSLQQDLTRLSPISRHIFAHKSGHDIPHQQPEIIAEAIAEVIELTRVMKQP